MTRAEQLAEIVEEYRRLRNMLEGADNVYNAVLELKRRLTLQLDYCNEMISASLSRFAALTELMRKMTEGEEWALGADELTADNWWHEESE